MSGRAGPQPRRRTVVRYHDATGQRCKSTDTGAVRHKTLTDTYYVRTPSGWMSLETRDLGEAWARLRSGKYGVAAQPAPEPATLAATLPAFLATLAHTGVSAQQIAAVRGHIQRIAALAGWHRLADLSADGLLAALSHLKTAGLSAQTRKHYLRHVYQLGRWCVPRLLPANPFAGMRAPSTATDRRHDRRCPTEDELARLFAYLDRPGCPVRGVSRIGRQRGMTGPQRKLGYQVCLATGFRANELRALRRQHFDLDAGSVALPATADKRRRAVRQPLPPWLADALRAWFAAGGGTWEDFRAQAPGDILQADLRGAGVPYQVPGPDGPLFFDFHSLRVWYITQLASQPGISPKDLMTLARHSDPRLTLAVYAKAKTESARAAASAIPPPGQGNA